MASDLFLCCVRTYRTGWFNWLASVNLSVELGVHGWVCEYHALLGSSHSFGLFTGFSLCLLLPTQVIVSDNGTGFVKCGYAGSNFPEFIFPSLVGRPVVRAQTEFHGIELKVPPSARTSCFYVCSGLLAHKATRSTCSILRGWVFKWPSARSRSFSQCMRS